MKFLVVILLILGGFVTFASGKISDVIFKQNADDNKKIVVKLIGFVIVIVAAIVAFCM